jgi:hypothetical protein
MPWQNVTFRPVALPAGATFDLAEGVLAWPTGEADGPGTYLLEFIVSDDAPCAGDSTRSFTLTMMPALALELVSLPDEVPRRFRFQGLASRAYEIQYTEVIEPAAWRLLQRIEQAAEGANEFTDPGESLATQRFYRVVWFAPTLSLPPR